MTEFYFNFNTWRHRTFIKPKEFKEFEKFIVTQCTSTPKDLNWLKNVIYQWNGDVGYLGYWWASFVVDKGDLVGIKATIGLNLFYLRTLDELKQTFSHEYGHHWTLSYFAKSNNIESLESLNEVRLPREYYIERGLNCALYNPGYKSDDDSWFFTDKEVIAEDYRVLFSPYGDEHKMDNDINKLGKPSVNVADFIWNLAKPSKCWNP
jgi:hypothetical protein